MGLSLEDVVSLDERPVNWEKPRGRKRGILRNPYDRRDFLRLIGAAGVGTGVALLGWLPPARRALATHSPYSLWEHCADINYGGCDGCLTTDSVVSSAYCAGDHWHRHDSVASGTTVTEYRLRLSSCTGNSSLYAGRNAWRWTVSACCNGRSGRRYRCSDGQVRVCRDGSCGTWSNTVCPRQIDSGTAC